MDLTKREFRKIDSPWRLARAMAAVGGALLVLYVATLSLGVYPGVSAKLIAYAVGVQPWTSAEHPLWRLCNELWLRVPLGGAVLRLNLSSAVYGALAAALLCQFVARWVYARILPEAAADEGRRLSLVSVGAGVVAAVLFGTSLAGWSAATRFHPGTFDLMLVLIAFSLYQNYQLSHKSRNLYALALLCGLGAAESVLFLVLAPFFIIGVIAVLYRHFRLRLRICSGLMVMGGLGASLYVVSARQFAHVAATAAGAPVDWSFVLRAVVRSQITEVSHYLPKVGWPVILLLIVVPWLACQMGYWERLHLKRNFRADALQLFLVAVVLLLQFNAPLPPWPQWLRSERLPVLEMALLAMLGGYACAYWLHGWLIAWGPAVNESVTRQKFRERFARFKKILSVGVCALFGVLLAGAAIGNGFFANGRRGAFADRCAQEILDQLGTRSWVMTDGVLDAHLAVRAASQGRTVRVLNLTADRDAAQIRRLRQWVAADPRLQANRARLLNAASLGVGTFVREWLAADPEANASLALYGVPDFYTEAGQTICPDRFLFLASHSKDPLRSQPFLAEHQAFWKRMCQELPLVRNIRDPIDLTRHLLRRHLSLVANDLGVLLTDLERPKEAYAAFAEALVLEPDNLSAKLNKMELVRDGLHPEEKGELGAAIKATFAEFRRQPTTFEVVRVYGQIHSPQALASVAAAWTSLGQYGLAQGTMARAASLAKDDDYRTALQTSLGGVRLTVRDTVRSEADFRMLLKSQPNNPLALLGMLDLALIRGDPADARNWLAQARVAGADATVLVLTEARIEIAERKYDACCKRLLELTDREPQNLNAWALLAAAMIQQGRATDVERQVLPKMEAVVNKQANPLVFQVRGAVIQAKGPASYGMARDAYRSALGMLPGRRELLEAVLSLDLALGDDVSAGKDASDLLRTDRDHSSAHFVLGTQAAAHGDLEAAEWHLRKSVAVNAAAVAWNNLAGLLRRRGELVEAEAAARQAVAKADTSAAFLDTLAAVLLDKSQIAEAKEIVTRARTLAPEDWQVAFTAARVLMQAGQPEEARVLLRQVQGHPESLPPATLAEVTRIANEWKSRR